MEWIAKYGHRALAASYLLMLALLFAMTVGQGQSLGSAIQAWGVMALAVRSDTAKAIFAAAAAAAAAGPVIARRTGRTARLSVRAAIASTSDSADRCGTSAAIMSAIWSRMFASRPACATR